MLYTARSTHTHTAHTHRCWRQGDKLVLVSFSPSLLPPPSPLPLTLLVLPTPISPPFPPLPLLFSSTPLPCALLFCTHPSFSSPPSLYAMPPSLYEM